LFVDILPDRTGRVSNSRELGDRIRRRARKNGANLAADVVDQLDRYYTLLAKWNEKINLTSFRLPPGGTDEAVDRLLIEPVVAAKHVAPTARKALDVGSGGGSPAIPLKLTTPTLALRMVESKTRKAVFLREAVRELGLRDVDVETSRFEELLARPELHEGLDLLTIRAVRVEPRTLVTLQAFLRAGGDLFLFRGPGGAEVAGSVTPPLSWVATYPLIEELRSRLVVLRKTPVGRS
jgi:16S rRNA (guanine527-N7)-methyltransferase